ncbi:Ig-like domain-containing protein [Shewanella sp. H8]|uniref:beta strand repeat-containing protein n=1 Tax=Shewanella sp. H8 TaxID=3342676 RepID=UPI003316287C
MESITTSKNGILSASEGSVSVTINNEIQELQIGEVVLAGAIVTSDLGFVITFDDGTIFNSDLLPNDESLTDVIDTADMATIDQVVDQEALDEITALQDLIASGEDPTKDLPETAAGTPTASQGDSGYVAVTRDADETLADAGYDTTGQTATQTAVIPEETISENDTPSTLINDIVTANEDNVATGNLLDNDSDVDSDLSVVSFEVDGQIYTAGTEITLDGGILIINEDGTYTFTPNENWNGQVPVITYTTNTGLTATLTIEIIPVDDASVVFNDNNTVAEGSEAAGNVLDNDSDVDSDLSVVSFEVDGQIYTAGTEVTLDGGILIINEDGTYTFTPNENWNGQVPVITYTTNTGLTATLTIEVTPVNDAPTIDVVANDFTENSAVDGDVAATYTTFDEDGDALTVDFTPGTNDDGYYALVNGEVVLTQAGADLVNNGGTLPSIDLTVSDGNLTGQDNDTPVITPTNDAPTVDVVANDFTENSAVDGDVAATYTTSDEDGDALTVDFTPGTNDDGYYALVNGEVVLTQDGADLVNNGGTLPPVDLTVSDGSLTGQDSDTPVITAMNDDFTDNNETRTIAEDSPEVTGNVIDGTSDDGTISVTTFTVAGDTTVHSADGTDVVIAGVGTFSLTDAGVYTFTPVANYNGTVPVITYTLTDGSGANDTSTLSLTVTPVNDDFTDNNETRTIAEDSPEVTGNVIDGTSDDGTISVTTFTVAGDTTVHSADGTDVVIAGVGTFSLTDAGVYTFTPVANYNGTVPVITYTLTDGSGANDTSTLSLTVTP